MHIVLTLQLLLKAEAFLPVQFDLFVFVFEVPVNVLCELSCLCKIKMFIFQQCLVVFLVTIPLKSYGKRKLAANGWFSLVMELKPVL